MGRGKTKVLGRRSVNPEPKLRLANPKPKKGNRPPPTSEESSDTEEENTPSGSGRGDGGTTAARRGRKTHLKSRMAPDKMFQRAKRYHELKHEILAPALVRKLIRHRLDEFLEGMDSETTTAESQSEVSGISTTATRSGTPSTALSGEGEEEEEGELPQGEEQQRQGEESNQDQDNWETDDESSED